MKNESKNKNIGEEIIDTDMSDVIKNYNFVHELLENIFADDDEKIILLKILSGFQNFFKASHVLYLDYKKDLHCFYLTGHDEKCILLPNATSLFSEHEKSMLFAIQKMNTSLIIENTHQENRFRCDEVLPLSQESSLILKKFERYKQLKGVFIFYYPLLNYHQLKEHYKRISFFMNTWSDIFATKIELVIESKKRKNIEEQLLSTKRLFTMNTLIRGIAHEIRNPLQIASGFLSLLRQQLEGGRLPLSADIEESMGKIELALDRINGTIHTMGQLQISSKNLVPIDINRLLQDLTERHQGHFQQNNIVLQFTPHEKPILFRAEADVISQIYYQLLLNALDALENTPRDPGTKKITVTLATTEKRCIQWCIHDNGAGIENNILSRIFDPFFTTKDPGKGPGLGLTLVHNSISALKGSVTIETEKDQFTKVCITLPLHKDDLL